MRAAGQLLRVEAPLPRCVAVAAGADESASAGSYKSLQGIAAGIRYRNGRA